MEIGGLSDFNYCRHAGGGRDGGGGTGGGRRGGRGQAPVATRGEAPGGGFETNLKGFMNKFCHEMRHDLWR